MRRALICLCPVQTTTPVLQVRLLRRLLEEAASIVTGSQAAKLNSSCEALVQLAEPGDAFSAFAASMNASAVASHIKVIEQKFGLKVKSCL